MKYFKEILLVITLIAIIISYIGAFEPFTWWLEVTPVFIGIVFLIIYRKFELSNLLYVVIFIHFMVLLIGGHYTYANVPFFEEIGDRNNYDKIGHFMQGFCPALIAREVFMRENIINSKQWLWFLILCFVMFVSSIYELIEWGISLSYGEKGNEFLGTQGYIWDTQTDMFMALIGAIVALIFFSKWHDLSMKRVWTKDSPLVIR